MAGTEIHEEICELARQRLAQYGYDADLRVGTNCTIPFTEDEFDYLVSWNVIHYEKSEAEIRRAIAEYWRVLKPGGRVIVSTTGPEHMILKNCETLGGHRYRIGRSDDFRQGEIFFCFDSARYIEFYFGEKFRQVMVGRIHDFLVTETQDYWIVTALK